MMRRRQRGFTLIEMIIVVVIIAVLAAIAIPAFNKYMDSGRAAEANAMLGEIRTREEAYRAEFGTYLSTQTTASELYTNMFPVVGTCPSGGEPCAKYATAPLATVPTAWTQLAINAQKSSLYCGYAAIAGAAGSKPSGLTIGSEQLPTNQTSVWWYAIGICDNNRTIAANTTYATAYNTTVVTVMNDHD
jgi:prepilin-type N-terminal cleavage/methylation domain-containing protein